MCHYTDRRERIPYDKLEMRGGKAVWSDVLAVYAVKTANDPNNPTEVASMDNSKYEVLKNIFWDMHAISSSTASKTEKVITEKRDNSGNIIETESTVTRTYLYITITHKSSDEMATQYRFTDEQKARLAELLSDENKKLWSGVLYGYMPAVNHTGVGMDLTVEWNGVLAGYLGVPMSAAISI